MKCLNINLIQTIKDNKYFFAPFFLFVIYGAIRIMILPQSNDLIWLNRQHNKFLDGWFEFWSFVGNGTFVVIALIPLIIFTYKNALKCLLAFTISGLIAQIVKNIAQTPRPKAFLADKVNLYFIQGIHIYSNNSFFSGHATTAFMFFLFLAFITKNKKLGILYFIFALMVAIARIYLCQHFFIDVYFGAINGVLFSSIVHLFIENSKYIKSKIILNSGLGEKISFLKKYFNPYQSNN